jgi:nitroimidazol reductase NimA-like FMN-containing flavoprotein (pyridoxamine 5'-phosphate oxidase superfamily)
MASEAGPTASTSRAESRSREWSRDLQEIDAASCRRLLASVRFGRVAVVDGERPVIVVLNHAVDGDDLLFRTSEDSRLARLTHDGEVPAAFEVDTAFPVERSGWSVIATGSLLREGHPARWAHARAKIRTWAAGERDVVLRLRISELTGRRIGPGRATDTA